MHKFRKSKDGVLRTDITVPFRIGRKELLNTPCYRIAHQVNIVRDDELVIELDNIWTNQETAIKAVKEELYLNGIDATTYWYDNTTELSDKIQEYAEKAITILFPQLCPPKNSQ